MPARRKKKAALTSADSDRKLAAPETMVFEIENIGGVEHFRDTLRPGMNVFSGPNGIGKTSAINALRRALGEKIEVERRDGSDHGTVKDGDGEVLLRVGQVARTVSQAELAVVDTSPVADIIDPGIKDPEAAAKRRIRGLVELVAPGVELRHIDLLVGGDEALVAFGRHTANEEAIEDIVSLSSKMKGHAEGLARAQEKAVDEATGRAEELRERRAEALRELGGEENLVELGEDAAADALVEASRGLERAQTSHRGRVEREERQRRVREALGDRVDPTAAEGRLAEARAAKEKADALRQKIADDLVEAESAVRETSQLVDTAERDLTSAREAAKILEQQPDGATDAEVRAAEEAVGAARLTSSRAALSRQARVAAEDAQACEDTVEEHQREADRLRSLAQAIPERLALVLADAGARGFTVVDGRLAVVEGDQTFDFEKRQSEGQQLSRVLTIAAQRYHGFVYLPGTFWSMLDPDRRAMVAAEASRQGFYGVTEQPTEGELRVEHLAPSDGGAGEPAGR